MHGKFESASGNSRKVQHLTHRFELAEAAEWLAIEVDCVCDHQLQFYVTDSRGVVRVQYYTMMDKKQIVLGSTAAVSSCGSVPGPIPQGTWILHLVGVPSELPLPYSLNVTAGTGDGPAGTESVIGGPLWVSPDAEAPLQYDLYDWNREYPARSEGIEAALPTTRWFAGDFHMHTLLSDGKRTPALLTEAALRRGLDFIVITEHNAMTTGWVETPLLVIPGVEITSSKGHFNAIGLKRWIDLIGNTAQPVMETEAGMNRILDEVRRQGAISSLNHPMLVPYEWRFEETPMDKFDTIELWNDPTFPDNLAATEQAVKVWDELWANGQLLWGIGGSDLHLLEGDSYVEGGTPAEVGDPTTFVWCDSLSANAVIAAAKQGQSYMTRGPRLSPVLEAAGRTYLPGQRITWLGAGDAGNAAANRMVELVYRIQVGSAPEGSRLIWVVDGQEAHVQSISPDVSDYVYRTAWDLEVFHWIRVEVRDADNQLSALVNPVYCGTPIPKKRLWSEFVSWKQDTVEGSADDRTDG